MVFHLFSVLVALSLFIVYSALGGGSGSADSAQAPSGLSADIPEVSDGIEIGRTRSDNRDLAERLDKSESQRRSAEASSFSLFDSEPSARRTPDGSVSSPQSDEDKVREARERSRRLLEGDGSEASSSRRSSGSSAGSSRRSYSPEADEYTVRRHREVDSARQAALRIVEESRDAGKRETSVKKESKEKPKAPSAEVETRERKSGFYGMDGASQNRGGGIRAVVHGEHKNLRKGATVKMRLLDNIKIGDFRVPKNTFVYGVLSFSKGRAQIHIENINLDGSIVPFRGAIYDKDGFEGLYVPDNVVDEAARNAGGAAVSSIDLDISSASSLVNSGVNAVTGAVKNAVSGSVREEKISISTNYKLVIKQKE